MPIIRLATPADAEPIHQIYAPFCLPDSIVSFEVAPPGVEEMARRITETLERFPWLVLEEDGQVWGYANAGPHSARAAYRWSVSVGIYIGEGHRQSGSGRALYASLFAALSLQGYVNAFAGITLPNPGSVGLHRAAGFEEIGIYPGVGFKAGAWRDTLWWARPLRDRPESPDPPISLAEAQRLPGWSAALESGLRWIGSRGRGQV